MNYEDWSREQLIARIKNLENPVKPVKKQREFDFSKHNTRFIAIRFAYLGWNYNGLAFQYEPTPLPTVEETILQALAKARMVQDIDPSCCKFSRCGRTDKGVSAMNQVISLQVRSSLSDEEQADKSNDDKEIPYMAILNSMLPPDIRITAICLRPPPKFDARFSCKYRHYKYILSKKDLDIHSMELAAQKYIGSHDFRNFCKIDGSKQITNYQREVYSAELISMDDEYMVFDLKGSAFLWHQVRCMVAVLLSVGQGFEQPSIVDELLNVEVNPRKPIFEMANDIPLVLYDCVFPDMEWLYPVDFPGSFQKNIKEFPKLKGFVMDMELKAHIGKIMRDTVIRDEDKLDHPSGSGSINLGDGRGRSFKKYVPIMARELGESFETVNARHKEKKRKREQSSE